MLSPSPKCTLLSHFTRYSTLSVACSCHQCRSLPNRLFYNRTLSALTEQSSAACLLHASLDFSAPTASATQQYSCLASQPTLLPYHFSAHYTLTPAHTTCSRAPPQGVRVQGPASVNSELLGGCEALASLLLPTSEAALVVCPFDSVHAVTLLLGNRHLLWSRRVS